jgi:hypothetical protein
MKHSYELARADFPISKSRNTDPLVIPLFQYHSNTQQRMSDGSAVGVLQSRAYQWNTFALDLVGVGTDGDAEIDGLAAGRYVGVFNEMGVVGTGGNANSDAIHEAAKLVGAEVDSFCSVGSELWWVIV